jgi:hypothetical protein
MKLKVTDAGVVVPRDVLPDVAEVEVRVEGEVVLIIPLRDADDAIWEMGSTPVTCGLSDASENHDHSLYAGEA